MFKILFIITLSNLLFSYNIPLDNRTIEIKATHEYFGEYSNKNEKDDIKLAKSLQNIFDAFQINDIDLYMKSYFEIEDFNKVQKSHPQFNVLKKRILKNKDRNRNSFLTIIDYMRKNNINIKNSKFIAIHREPIDHDSVQNIYVIRKVYLIFQTNTGKKYRIYLKTMTISKDGIWKMVKYSLMDKDITSNSYN